MAKIKICGLKRKEDIEAVNQVKPDFCGFVIEVPKSSRCVSRDQVRILVEGLQKEILPVGVFVNAPAELVAELLEEGTLSMAQLHGSEDENYIKKLRSLTDKPLIQAFSIQTAQDVERAYGSSADYILLDQGGGGTGKTFDWTLVSNRTAMTTKPFFLAGGLHAGNIERAIRELHPWAVDLSSSLEVGGVKDLGKMREAVEIVRAVSLAEEVL
ncbi:MAG: phosphoribosylanthranilate isomerase [bacterium]|nr:phosphoribosylanthranilate isomerase [bacterium]